MSDIQHRCPFCRRNCDVHWDCECGAKAVNSVFWADQSKPLMSRGFSIKEMEKQPPEGEKE